jgi:DNA-binding CsgD family transcriptional regulator
MAHLDLGQNDEAERWLDLASQAVVAAPTPLRARRLEFWRGLARASAGDAAGMREHFERALRAATEQGRAAGRCEILARMAIEAARLGGEQGDDELLAVAEGWAKEAKELVPFFVGHQPWGAQADAALAEVALARGDLESAGRSGMEAMQSMMEAMREDVYPELFLPTARAVLAAGPEPAKEMARAFLQVLLAFTVLRTEDDDVRARWFRGPIGREWSRLAGPVGDGTVAGPGTDGALASLSEDERRLLGLLTEGMPTAEVADRMGISRDAVRLRLQEMFAKIGATSRGDATVFALAQGVL